MGAQVAGHACHSEVAAVFPLSAEIGAAGWDSESQLSHLPHPFPPVAGADIWARKVQSHI